MDLRETPAQRLVTRHIWFATASVFSPLSATHLGGLSWLPQPLQETTHSLLRMHTHTHNCRISSSSDRTYICLIFPLFLMYKTPEKRPLSTSHKSSLPLIPDVNYPRTQFSMNLWFLFPFLFPVLSPSTSFLFDRPIPPLQSCCTHFFYLLSVCICILILLSAMHYQLMKNAVYIIYAYMHIHI